MGDEGLLIRAPERIEDFERGGLYTEGSLPWGRIVEIVSERGKPRIWVEYAGHGVRVHRPLSAMSKRPLLMMARNDVDDGPKLG